MTKICCRFDADKYTPFLICSRCGKQINDGAFYYPTAEKKIVCETCEEGKEEEEAQEKIPNPWG